ncbi:MAG: hypothetical protein RR221_02340 [Alistipes sp.]
MESFAVLLGLIMLVFGVLQIVLFFKLWGMTIDIKKIKNETCKEFSTDDLQWKIRALILLNRKEQAEELIVQYFIEQIYDMGHSGILLTRWKNQCRESLERLGLKLPEQIEKLSTKMDVENLFSIKKLNAKASDLK